ncbi:MAG: hypothetical protein ACLSAO_03950 [Anaerovoracaceae bacterium]
MKKVYVFIKEKNIAAIYSRRHKTLFVSTNPKSIDGIIYIR